MLCKAQKGLLNLSTLQVKITFTHSIFGQYSQESKIKWLNLIVSVLVCYITIKDLFMTSLILVQSGT